MDPEIIQQLTALIKQQVLEAIDARLPQASDAHPATQVAEAATAAAENENVLTEEVHEEDGEEIGEDISSSQDSDSDVSWDRRAKQKKKHAKAKRKKFASFASILELASESSFFIGPRGLKPHAEPALFVPPAEARQSTQSFQSPLLKFMFESVYSIGFFTNVMVTATTAVLDQQSDPTSRALAAFLRQYWAAIHNLAADAALLADLQTDTTVPKETARAALMMRSSAPAAAAPTPLAREIARIQRKAGEAALKQAVKAAQVGAVASKATTSAAKQKVTPATGAPVQQRPHRGKQHQQQQRRHLPRGVVGVGQETAPTTRDA